MLVLRFEDQNVPRPKWTNVFLLNFTLCMTMPQAAGKKRITLLVIREFCLIKHCSGRKGKKKGILKCICFTAFAELQKADISFFSGCSPLSVKMNWLCYHSIFAAYYFSMHIIFWQALLLLLCSRARSVCLLSKRSEQKNFIENRFEFKM